ncbi:MAG: hypothetical protein KC492_07300, partial [Myxococcales bacterium]|nr:hypothetical protein [Myxococcales bacterium]
ATLLGFSDADVERALATFEELSPDERRRIHELMRRFFNGYRFYGGSDPLYNSTMVMSFLERLQSGELRVSWLLDETIDDIKLNQIIGDDNVDASENSVRTLVSGTPRGASLVLELLAAAPRGVEAESVHALFRNIRLRQLLTNDSNSRTRALAFMYHHGLVTLAEHGDDAIAANVRLPNLAMELRHMQSIKEAILPNTELRRVVLEPSAELLHSAIDAMCKQVGGTLALDKEAPFESLVVHAFLSLAHNGPVHVIQQAHLPASGSVDTDAGAEDAKGFSDVLLVATDNDGKKRGLLLELKASKKYSLKTQREQARDQLLRYHRSLMAHGLKLGGEVASLASVRLFSAVLKFGATRAANAL